MSDNKPVQISNAVRGAGPLPLEDLLLVFLALTGSLLFDVNVLRTALKDVVGQSPALWGHKWTLERWPGHLVSRLQVVFKEAALTSDQKAAQRIGK